MVRILSLLLLLVAALGAATESAWAGEAQHVSVETNGLDFPPTHEVEDVEVMDEVVFNASSIAELPSPLPMFSGERRPEIASDVPPTRPPRG